MDTAIAQFVYMFGFVQCEPCTTKLSLLPSRMLTGPLHPSAVIPQLIINWKLKSVAHMPVRSLTYKFLNTVRACLALISDIVT